MKHLNFCDQPDAGFTERRVGGRPQGRSAGARHNAVFFTESHPLDHAPRVFEQRRGSLRHGVPPNNCPISCSTRPVTSTENSYGDLTALDIAEACLPAAAMAHGRQRISARQKRAPTDEGAATHLYPGLLECMHALAVTFLHVLCLRQSGPEPLQSPGCCAAPDLDDVKPAT